VSRRYYVRVVLRIRLAMPLALVTLLVPAAPAAAAVSASIQGSTIAVTGTTGDDATLLTDEGANVRITNATAGSGCSQSGGDALCPRGTNTISADLLAGADDFESLSSAEANVLGREGADFLVGRLRSAQGGDAKDVIRTSGMTGVVSLDGGADVDVFDIGANTAASDIVTDTGAYMVDYLSRPAGSGGVTVIASDSIANDGASGEFDNVGAATLIRGTVNSDNLTGSAGNSDKLDGELGADFIDGGDDLPTPGIGGTAVPGDALVFGMDAAMPYARPAASTRTQGVTADLAAGTSSDGDTLTRMDDLRGTQQGDTLRGAADRDVIHGGGGSGEDTVTSGGETDAIQCGGGLGNLLIQLVLVSGAHGGPGIGADNGCKLTVDAGDGDDNVTGGTQGETIRGGAGADNLNGGDGGDTIVGGPGVDQLQGSTGSDTASFAEDTAGVNVNLASGSGQEVSGGNFENAIGSPFNDTLAGTTGANVLNGGAGSDTLSYADRTAGVRIDLAAGTAAEDTVAAFERANGGAGADALIGTTAANTLIGNNGDDVVRPGLGPDVVVGGNGRDRLDFDYLSAGSAGITHTIGGSGASNTEGDISLEIEELSGSKGADVLIGTSQGDGLSGNDGNDRLVPGAGADTLRGGLGSDTLDYSASPVAIHAHLNQVGGLEVREFASTQTRDTLSDQLENLKGSQFADVLRGSDQFGNDLRGGGGGDVIDGRSGDDVLHGDGGNDRFGKVSGSVLETATASQVTVGNGSEDGRDTVFGGTGNDDANVRDAQLDDRVDCGAGTDIARQDLVDDDGDLDIDNCESIETTAVDQRAMTRIVRIRKRGSRLRVTLACPRRSRVRCKGRAAMARTPKGRRARATRYKIRKGRRRTITVRRFSRRRRYLVLSERDQRRRVRRLVRRVR